MPAPMLAFATSLCRELTFTSGVPAHQPRDALETSLCFDLFANLGHLLMQSHAQREDVSLMAFWWLMEIRNWLLDAWCPAAKW